MKIAKKILHHSTASIISHVLKRVYFENWCGANTLGDSGVNTLGDTSAFVNPTVQLLLTRRDKIRMDGVFEFYIAPL